MKDETEPKKKRKEMKVERGVELSRYMGRWYEIACIPSRFQPRDGENTRATYTLEEGGRVKVVNETWSGGGGKRSYIEGSAYKADPDSDEAKLKVKFWVPPMLPIFPVVGDYWILHLDHQHYHYALVGQPSLRYLWILCRKPTMEEEIYKLLLEKATEQGYDVSQLVKTPQADPPPEGDEGPKDTKGFWWFKSILGN